mmetsp:Transcript_37465/g.98259  ORF Transcript_37465/g.98259 Transcript_37465/m.98259 type:complete len:648 (+) Transcript_37465:23-1966(+)
MWVVRAGAAAGGALSRAVRAGRTHGGAPWKSTGLVSPTTARWLSASPVQYEDEYIREVLGRVKTIAMVGASDNWNRPSYFAMSYLQNKGYRVIPVNARAEGKTVLGEHVYGSIADIPAEVEIDMVDLFRAPAAAPGLAEEAAARGAKVLWMQLGVISEEAASIAETAGMDVVMDRCPKIEFSRLYGELGWHGFNSGVMSSKRRMPGQTSSTTDGTIPCESAGFDTKALHAGAYPDPASGARQTPIFQTSSFVFDSADHAAGLFNLQTFGHIYGRLSNPTTAVLEERVAALEGGRGATCTSSGHAAQLLTLFPLMGPGTRVVASDKLYGGSVTQFAKTITKFGWHCTFVDVDDPPAVEAALAQPDTRLLWAESIANPAGAISDIGFLAEAAHAVDVPLVIDNTAATPYLCRPIEHGADIVVHSTTKYMSGHGQAVGGCVVDSGKFDWSRRDPDGSRFPSMTAPEPAYHGLVFAEQFGDLAFTIFGHAVGLRDLGCTMAPQNAFYTLLGIETLSLRMDRHCSNALALAKFLEKHPKVSGVSYSGLPSSKYYDRVQTHLPQGAGALYSFNVVGGYDAGRKVVESTRLFSHVANLGDTRSLVLHPASTTHRQLTPEQRDAAGAGDDVVRLSVGIENIEDLIADLDRALSLA